VKPLYIKRAVSTLYYDFKSLEFEINRQILYPRLIPVISSFNRRKLNYKVSQEAPLSYSLLISGLKHIRYYTPSDFVITVPNHFLLISVFKVYCVFLGKNTTDKKNLENILEVLTSVMRIEKEIYDVFLRDKLFRFLGSPKYKEFLENLPKEFLKTSPKYKEILENLPKEFLKNVPKKDEFLKNLPKKDKIDQNCSDSLYNFNILGFWRDFEIKCKKIDKFTYINGFFDIVDSSGEPNETFYKSGPILEKLLNLIDEIIRKK
jgi:hypothetical protein